MATDGLATLVGTLRARIGEHGAALSVSETRTRYALVDPMLRGLGWDTGDPAMFAPEYRLPAGDYAADCALFGADAALPLMALRAQRLGADMEDDAMRGLNGCFLNGIRYFAATDGRIWDVYDTFKPVPVAEKRVAWFDIQSGDTERIVMSAMELRRESVLGGALGTGGAAVPDAPQAPTPAPDAASTPTATSPPPSRPTSVNLDADGRIIMPPRPTTPPQSPPSRRATDFAEEFAKYQPDATRRAPSSRGASPRGDDAGGVWIPLSDQMAIENVSESQHRFRSGSRKQHPAPTQILFPDGTKARNREGRGGWRGMASAIIGWLLRNNHLHADNWTIPKGRRYILHTTPVHPSGSDFEYPLRVGNLYYDRKYNRHGHIRNMCLIITSAGLAPADFKLRFQR